MLRQQEFESFFRDSTFSALRNLLGEGSMRAVVHNLDLAAADSIQSIHAKLSSVFKMGTPVLERAIMKEAFSRMKVPYAESERFDFANEFKEAYSKFVVSTGERKA